MQRTRRVLAAAAAVMLAALVLALSPLPRVDAADARKSREKAKKLQTQIEELRGKVRDTKAQERDILQELKDIDQGLEKASRHLDETTLQLQRSRAQEMKIQGDLDTAQAEYGQYRDTVAGHLVSYYKSGRVGYIEVMLKSSSMEDFISRVHYVRTLLKNNRILVMNLRKERDSIKAYHDDLSKARVRIEKLAEDTRVQQEAIAAERAQREYMLTRIMGEKKYYTRTLEEMEIESRAITGYIQSEALNVYVPGTFGGQLFWPFHGRLTSTFGQRWGRAHTGIDIDCVTGDPLVAADSGVVILSGWKNGYGNTVIIQHAGNISTLYGHGSRVIASRGSKVRRGELVMLCGSTGYSTGDHLHFEVRINGVPVNPLKYMR